MSVVRIATVSLLLAASSICSIARNSKPLFPTWPDMPPFPTWPGLPPLPPWGNMPPFPPYGGMPPGGWPPGQGGDGGCSCSCSCSTLPPRPPKVFVVGDDKGWTFGFNYTDWALKNSPFYVDDVLEFKYPRPSAANRPHSVYLLKDYESFQNCDLDGSRRIGDEYAGAGSDGFKLKLDENPSVDPFYYIACGEKKGFHCNVGTMKFIVMPLISGR